MLVREADAAAGWRYQRGSAREPVQGNGVRTLASDVSLPDRRSGGPLFERAGFDVRSGGTGEGTPFANVLFVLTRRRAPLRESEIFTIC